METSIHSLSSELHEAIAAHLQLEDLLNFSCACQQFHKTIKASSDVWKNLYNVCFGSRLHPDDVEAKTAFEMRCEKIDCMIFISHEGMAH